MPKLYDNTRLSAAKTCLRLFYFRHRRHWRPDGTGIKLVFGSSWHAGQDQIWPHLNRGASEEETLKLAILAFDEKWTEGGFPGISEWSLADSERYSPHTPGVAAEMLLNYIKHRGAFIRDIELLAVEMPFAVPLTLDQGPSAPLAIGRTDKVIRLTRPTLGLRAGVWGIEHKTTAWYKKDGGFRSEWMESFSPNSQIDGYVHQLNMNYENARGILVDGALVHKTVHDKFKFIPCDRLLEQLDAWLNETLYYIKQIEEQDNALSLQRMKGISEKVPFLQAFPKNTESCAGKYMQVCAYRDLCRFNPNPEKLVEPPMGYIEEEWSPFDVLKLEKIGIKPE